MNSVGSERANVGRQAGKGDGQVTIRTYTNREICIAERVVCRRGKRDQLGVTLADE